MPTTVVRSTIRARCHTPPLIQRCHHVWHTTGVSDGGCKPARHMWMVLWLTVPYRHCQLPEQCGVTLVTSDSTMTDCPNHRLWHIMVKCHRPPMSHHTSMSTHSLPYIGMSSDWPQKPREEDMPLTWSQQVQIQTLILGCRCFLTNLQISKLMWSINDRQISGNGVLTCCDQSLRHIFFSWLLGSIGTLSDVG